MISRSLEKRLAKLEQQMQINAGQDRKPAEYNVGLWSRILHQGDWQALSDGTPFIDVTTSAVKRAILFGPLFSRAEAALLTELGEEMATDATAIEDAAELFAFAEARFTVTRTMINAGRAIPEGGWWPASAA